MESFTTTYNKTCSQMRIIIEREKKGKFIATPHVLYSSSLRDKLIFRIAEQPPAHPCHLSSGPVQRVTVLETLSHLPYSLSFSVVTSILVPIPVQP
jgi:ABC-type polar amino acid transport system ATPase subunit